MFDTHQKQYSPIFDYIEYALEYDTRKKRIIFAFGDYKKDYYSSAYIDWSTKDYLNDGQQTIKMVLDYVPRYMWEINKTTDTITTNLSLNSIKLLYPEFEGVYIFKKYKEIIIDFNYSTFDSTFYQNIKFIDY